MGEQIELKQIREQFMNKQLKHSWRVSSEIKTVKFSFHIVECIVYFRSKSPSNHKSALSRMFEPPLSPFFFLFDPFLIFGFFELFSFKHWRSFELLRARCRHRKSSNDSSSCKKKKPERLFFSKPK